MADDMVIDVTPDELRAWMQQSTTRKFFNVVNYRIQEITEQILDGAFVAMDSVETTALFTTRAAGRLQGLKELQLLVTELQEEEENDTDVD